MSKQTQNKELRSIVGTVEIRQAEDGSESRTIEGYAVVFNKDSKVMMDWGGQYIETVDRDAFSEVDMSDVVATFNHDFNLIQGRTSSNTLQLSIDDYGLKYKFDAPNTTAGNDLLENIRNGNVKGSSFMFTIKTQRWTWAQDETEMDRREILKVDKLFEVGPVVIPAYNDTTAASRSYKDLKDEQRKDIAAQRLQRNKIKCLIVKHKHK